MPAIGARAPGSRLPALDLLRSVAVAAVYLFHYGIFGDKVFLRGIGQYGWMGVDLFFVLSGYLIAGQLLRPVARGEAPRVGRFMLRRALRTLPAYLALLTVYFAWPAFAEREGLAPLGSFLTFTQNFHIDSSHHAFSHAWSLCIEEQFYLVLPFLVLALARFRKDWAAGSLMVAVFAFGLAYRSLEWTRYLEPLLKLKLSSLYDQAYSGRIYYATWGRLDGLLAGVSVASLQCFRPGLWARLTRRGNLLLALGAALFVAACALTREVYPWSACVLGFPLIAVSFSLLLLAGLSEGAWLNRARVPGTGALAAVSYSYYLMHKPLTRLSHRWLESASLPTHGPAAFALTTGACLLGSALLYFSVERPFLRLRERLLFARLAVSPLPGSRESSGPARQP